MVKTFVIAEAGVNHNGDEQLALQLIDVAARSGADAVKFQTFSAEKLVAPGTKTAAYQERETGSGDQYKMLKALELSESVHQRLFDRCTSLGIEFMSTPFDEHAADFLLKLGMKRIKIPSGEITNEPFIKFLAAKGFPIILSTGMATMDEIQRAIAIIRSTRKEVGLDEPLSEALTILHCTSNYPANFLDVHLQAMHTIALQTALPVGYSDHTLGVEVSIAAVAMGATVIEKHFTLDKTLPGPDHKASLSPEELSKMVCQIRNIEDAMGLPDKCPAKSELPIRDLVRRSVTATRLIHAGEFIKQDDIALLRPGTGIPPGEHMHVVGRKAGRDIPAGTTLQWSDLT
jgi:N,N'-diacetyllegionaminate synthase